MYFFRIPKNSQDSFTIVHTAKDVDYCITGFRMKNKDELSNDLEQVMNNSKTRTIYYIFQGLTFFQGIKRKEKKFINFYNASGYFYFLI